MVKALTFIVAVWALVLAGCRGSRQPGGGAGAKSRPASQATRPAEEPKLPDEVAGALSAGATEILVNDDDIQARPEPTYVRKEDCPVGKLSGVCRFLGPLVRRPQPPGPEDLAKGPCAITEPLKGEVDYYTNIRIRKPQYYRNGRNGYPQPSHVVLIFREVKLGRRAPLTPTGFMAIHGYTKALRGNYGGRTNISFAPLHARVTFFTYEAYPCTFILSRADTGRNLFEGRVTYRDEGAKRAKDVGGGHRIWIASKPKPIQSPILRQPGRYTVTTRRHPWKVGHVFLVDNPYVAVVGGGFEVKDIPVGRHVVDVWHPVYEPNPKTLELEIRQDETAEVAIEFNPPAELVAAPKKPRK